MSSIPASQSSTMRGMSGQYPPDSLNDGTIVKYSRPQGRAQKREKEELQRKVVELERIEIEKHTAEELLTEWQTANLVIQAFGSFVWSLISNVDKEELAKYGMTNFYDICSFRWSSDSAERQLARQVYNKIDEDVRCLGEQILSSKQYIRNERHLLAHPIISDAQLKAFLKDLGDGGPKLKPMEIAVFNYLKVTTNTKANIEASRR